MHRLEGAICRSESAIHRPGGAMHRLEGAICRSESAIHRPGGAMHRSEGAIHVEGAVQRS